MNSIIIEQALTNKIKTCVRITSRKEIIDEEINDLIMACILDLRMGGVTKTDLEDKLILQAIRLYAKANYSFDSKDIERFKASYEALKCSLALSGDYTVENEDVEP